jgi:regulatory protein
LVPGRDHLSDGHEAGRPSGRSDGREPKLRGTARDRALNLLSFRDRSRRELERRLLRAGFEPDDVLEALDGLERAGLVDDERYARALVEQHTGRRLSGARAVAAALATGGVSREAAAAALAGLDEPGAERRRAEALARSRAARLSGLAPEVAFRHLCGLLARRGYPPNVSRDAARAALSIDDDGS